MPTTTKLGLPYPAATQPPDVPGDIYALANTIDQLPAQLELAPHATIASGASYDDTNGLNAITVFGPLRIVHFSIYRASGFQQGEFVVNLNPGYRPTNIVHDGCLIYDDGQNETGSCYIDTTGSICVSAYFPDKNSEGRFNAARGTLHFYGV